MAFRMGLRMQSRKELENRRYIKMISKRDGECEECEDDILEGDMIVWDTQEFKAYCSDCGKDLCD